MATTFGPRIEKEPFFTSSPFQPVESPPTSLDDINLSDHDLYVKGDLDAPLRILREQSPIFWHTQGGAKAFGVKPYWAVTSHEGFTQVIDNHDVFSSLHPAMDRTSEEMHKPYHAAVERYINGMVINAAKEAVDKAIRAAIAEFANNGGTDMAPLCYYTQGSVAFAFHGLKGGEAELLRDIMPRVGIVELVTNSLSEYTKDEGVTKILAPVEDILADRR